MKFGKAVHRPHMYLLKNNNSIIRLLQENGYAPRAEKLNCKYKLWSDMSFVIHDNHFLYQYERY